MLWVVLAEMERCAGGFGWLFFRGAGDGERERVESRKRGKWEGERETG